MIRVQHARCVHIDECVVFLLSLYTFTIQYLLVLSSQYGFNQIEPNLSIVTIYCLELQPGCLCQFLTRPLNETDIYYQKKHVLFIICDASDEF